MDTNNEEREMTGNSAYNAFPEPQTIPSGWDLSMFSFEPQSESTADEDDAAES